MMHSPIGKNTIVIFHEVGLPKVLKEGIIRDSERMVRTRVRKQNEKVVENLGQESG